MMTHQHQHQHRHSHRINRFVLAIKAFRARQIAAALAAVLAIACCVVQPTTAAAATHRIVVTEIKPLLMHALERGEAHGVLTGIGATYTQHRFNSSSPIEIDVLRLHALPQIGCGRLEVTTHQRAVVLDGKRQDQQLVYQLSFCADGRLLRER